MSMRHASVLLLATACSSQSALIGEQDEPVDGMSTSSVGGSTPTGNAAGSGGTSTEGTTTGVAGAAAVTTEGTSSPPELGPCEDPTEIALPPKTIATRLAKLMFDAPPSAELLASAQDGELSTYGKVECKALDMIEQPEHETGLLAFLDAWLGVSSWQREPLADLPEGISPEMQTEATMFLENFVASGDTTLAHLFTEPETHVGAALAQHYGVEPVPEGDSEPVEVAGHRGLLTLGLITASLRRIGPRGYYTANKFLCLDIDLPPSISQEIPRVEDENYRDTYDSSLAPAACAACHLLFDGPGHALENFDELGRWQETDAGTPVRTNGKLVTSFTNGDSFEAFEDTSEFIDELSHNPIVPSFAKQAAAFVAGVGQESVGEKLSERDIQKVVTRFEKSERDLSYVLVGLTQTDLFWQ